MCHTEVVLKGLGATSWAVAFAIRSERTRQKVSLRDLAKRLPEDAKLSHATLSEIERGDRRVSVDDLTALAAALGVSPVTFLLPYDPSSPPPDPQTVPARLTGTPEVPLNQLVNWVRGDASLDTDADAHTTEAFRRGALPPWLWRQDESHG